MRVTPQDFEDIYATARMAHVGQKRRSGEDYFSHPSAVRNLVRKYYPGDSGAEMVALLHDTIEDAPGSTVASANEMKEWIRNSIADHDSAEEIISTVERLTHEKGQDYTSYITSLMDSPLALKVKLTDMLHNLSSSPSPRQKEKYSQALQGLSTAAGGIPAGINGGQWDTLMKLSRSTNEQLLRRLVKELILIK